MNFFSGSVGNLLPLSQSINSSLQNDCFEDKRYPPTDKRKDRERQGYNNGSHSEIEVSNYEVWDAHSILDRGLKLLKFMERRWDLKFENEEAKKNLLFLDFLD